MIRIIVYREIHENTMSSRFALATILCLILVILGTYVSVRDYEKRMSVYSNAIQREKGAVAVELPKVYRKPEVLGVFSQGIDKKFGRVVDFKDYFWNGTLKLTGEMRTHGTRQSVYLRNLAAIDFVFVVRVVMSLLAIFLAYDTVSGEREAGVLKLIMANAIPRSSILVGKYLGGILCLCVPLAMSLIIAILMVQLLYKLHFEPTDWIRLGVIFMLSVLYLMGFYALSLFVSCLTKTSATSLTISLMIWIMLLVIVPNVGPALVKRFWTVTSRDQMVSQRDQLDKEYLGKIIRRPRETYKKRAEIEAIKYERARALWRLSQEHKKEMDQQTEAGRWLARLSPCSALNFAASAFARTDIKTSDRFIRNVYMFFAQIELLQKMISEKGWMEFERQTRGYEYSFKMPESLAESLYDAIPDVALIMAFPVVFFMAAYASFVRREVG